MEVEKEGILPMHVVVQTEYIWVWIWAQFSFTEVL